VKNGIVMSYQRFDDIEIIKTRFWTVVFHSIIGLFGRPFFSFFSLMLGRSCRLGSIKLDLLNCAAFVAAVES